MDNIIIDGKIYSVNFEYDDYAKKPWEWCDGHGVIRQSSKPHQDGYSDKLPGEVPLNSAGRNEYQFYYDVPASLAIAKREGWNAAPYDAPNKALRAVDADIAYLRAYLNDIWHYVTVTVTDNETGESTNLGMVETWKDYHLEVARELADELHRAKRVANRFTDAMALGV